MSFKLVFICGSFIICIGSSLAQNLVPNPSFEETPCDSNWVPLSFPAEYWFNPNSASPDYYAEDFGPNGCGIVQVPENEEVRTGEFMAGIWAGQPSSGTREYIQVALSSSLEADSTYCISLYMRRYGASNYAVDRFGVMLSADSLYDTSTSSVLEGGLSYLSSEVSIVIEDTLNWTELSWEYTAQGGERFITIGNHWDNSLTQYVDMESGFFEAAYYFVDDVSVQKCTVTSLYEFQSSFRAYPNPFKDELWIESASDMQMISIYDAKGNLVESIVCSGSIRLDTSTWSEGLYVLVLAELNSSVNRAQRFIKVH